MTITLTPDEEKETLFSLIGTLELANTKRRQSLAELAMRRGLSLEEIAREI